MVECNIGVGYWGGGDMWQWIDYLYFLSFVKVGVSVVKYIPQVSLISTLVPCTMILHDSLVRMFKYA